MLKLHIKLPKLKKPWINNIKLDGDKLKQNSETCVNPIAPQSLAAELQETQLEHQQLYTAQERQLQLEAQTLRQSQHEEQQAAVLAREHELAIQKLRQQAEEQPEILKPQWRRQLSQQASYKAEIHELYTGMLNTREKSEMKSALSAQMCRVEAPTRSVEAEPENVLKTVSPGRCSTWFLPHEIMATPERPTTGGLRSPEGLPLQLGPSPLTRQYRRSPMEIPPTQWGNHVAREEGGKDVNCSGIHFQMKKIQFRMYSNQSREWRTRMSSTSHPFQALPTAAVPTSTL